MSNNILRGNYTNRVNGGTETAPRKREIRITTVILTVIALAFYGGFILLGVLRA